MIARCARCQQTFSTERFGVQTCPHCGGEVLLADPNAPPPAPGGGAVPPGAGAVPPGPGAVPPGAPPPGPGAPTGWGGPPGQPPPAEESAPFVRRKELGFFPAFFRTWKLAALEPAGFFRTVKMGESGSAVLFGVLAITVSQWFQVLWGWLINTSMQGVVHQVMRRMPQGGEIDQRYMAYFSGTHPAVVAVQLVGAPLYALVYVFLAAGLIHLFLLLFKGAPRGFDTTLTVVGYAAGVQLVAAAPVPGLAFLAAAVWFLVAVIVGLGEAQRCGSGKAAAATLLPGALFCLCCCGGLAALAAIVASAAKAGG